MMSTRTREAVQRVLSRRRSGVQHNWRISHRPHPGGNASLYEINGRAVTLNLHSGQMQAHHSDKRFVFVIAGTQGGKTSYGPWWLQREIERCGGGDYIAATSSYDLFKLKMLPEIREVFEHLLGIGRYWTGDKVLELRNPETGEFDAKRADDKMWGRVILRSANSTGGLESTTAKAAWLDEVGQDDFTLQAWEAVRRRVSLERGRVLGTTTPYNLGWLKQVIFDKWEAGAEDIDVIQFASTNNPAFPQEEFDEVEQTMQEWKFRMFYKGEFGKPAGLIYKAFIDQYREQGGHLVHPFPLPTQWPRIVSIDPGAVNHCKLWWAHDTDRDVWYVYREHLEGDKATREHAAEIRRQAAEEQARVIGYYIGAKSESQQRMDYESEGLMPTYEPPVADVESGIDTVVSLLKQHRIYFFDDLSGLRDQFGRYKRVTDAMGETTEKIQDKEKFHFLDALRYGAVAAGTPPPAITRMRKPAPLRLRN